MILNICSRQKKKIMLFNKGDKCLSITGGWSKWNNSSYTDVTFNNDIAITYHTDSGGVMTVFVYTTNIIDITDVTSVYANVTQADLYTKDSSFITARLLLFVKLDNGYMNPVSDAYVRITKPGVVTFKIPDYLKQYNECYVGIDTTASHGTILKIDKIWCE